MLENISLSQIAWLRNQKLTLSHLKYMEELLKGNGVPQDTYYTSMEKIGVVFRNELTEFGKEIYTTFQTISGDVKLTKKKVKLVDEEFEQWWKNYPPTPNHGAFTSTRNLRVKKDECQKLFRDILNEGHTLQSMINAVNTEVSARKIDSIRTGKNEMNFMKGTESYLNSRQFEVYLDVVNKPKAKFTNTI